jgi:hypothetical protein
MCQYTWNVPVAGTPELENIRLDHPRQWSGEGS